MANLELTHTKNHRCMADIVFNNGDDEVIADLLRAWTVKRDLSETYKLLELLDTLPRNLIRLQHRMFTSQRLRRLVIRCIEQLGSEQVGRVGVEKFTALLGRLSVGVGEMYLMRNWFKLLLDVVQSPQGRRGLPDAYWESMVVLAPDTSGYTIHDDLVVMLSLEKEKEWYKLECWSGYFWLQ